MVKQDTDSVGCLARQRRTELNPIDVAGFVDRQVTCDTLVMNFAQSRSCGGCVIRLTNVQTVRWNWPRGKDRQRIPRIGRASAVAEHTNVIVDGLPGAIRCGSSRQTDYVRVANPFRQCQWIPRRVLQFEI